ncbi:hypothetical protein LAZ40_16210 [Cereibacter sphaeroides]|uniref:phage tail assembly chaperone n=1 Tax=Cereibacter sphaeroides TaxID=1063 RepID=UPI001F370172|nr:hypothetical protein [Cereibacter sphaeroides]MCE6960569.1 hypothetical protein [Cereibacter sphaeroides]MCE6972750.1 hypothetical protein [Cereibacter sphaeroides]
MDATTRLQTQICTALRQRLAGQKPRLPDAAGFLWGAFWQLSRCRTMHAAGPNPIGWTEIVAWARLMRVPLEPHHVAILTAMDDVWLDHAYGARGPGGQAPAVQSSQPLTPQILDAMFG